MPCKRVHLLSCLAASASFLGGCTAPLPLSLYAPTANAVATRDLPARKTLDAAAPNSTESANSLVAAAAAANEGGAAVARALAYADRIRGMNANELTPELARLGEARAPGELLQLALTLAQLRQTPELIRAQDLLTRLLANASPEAVTLHPLARLLATRFGEQRRFEDLLDKQQQQTRDIQRRLDQTTERLEALKAIERSLGNRAPAATPPGISSTAPSSRPRAGP